MTIPAETKHTHMFLYKNIIYKRKEQNRIKREEKKEYNVKGIIMSEKIEV